MISDYCINQELPCVEAEIQSPVKPMESSFTRRRYKVAAQE